MMVVHLANVSFSIISAWRVRKNIKSIPCVETIEGLMDCQLSARE